MGMCFFDVAVPGGCLHAGWSKGSNVCSDLVDLKFVRGRSAMEYCFSPPTPASDGEHERCSKRPPWPPRLGI